MLYQSNLNDSYVQFCCSCTRPGQSLTNALFFTFPPTLGHAQSLTPGIVMTRSTTLTVDAVCVDDCDILCLSRADFQTTVAAADAELLLDLCHKVCERV